MLLLSSTGAAIADIVSHVQAKPLWKRLGYSIALLVVAVAAGLVMVYIPRINHYNNTVLNPVMKWHMLSTTRAWARLAPLPDSAEDIQSRTEGGMLTRQYVSSFTAPLPAIKQWLDASPALRDVRPVRYAPANDQAAHETPQAEPGSRGLGKSGGWYYEIKPNNGARYAAVWVDVESRLVQIQVKWNYKKRQAAGA